MLSIRINCIYGQFCCNRVDLSGCVPLRDNATTRWDYIYVRVQENSVPVRITVQQKPNKYGLIAGYSWAVRYCRMSTNGKEDPGKFCAVSIKSLPGKDIFQNQSFSKSSAKMHNNRTAKLLALELCCKYFHLKTHLITHAIITANNSRTIQTQ